MNNMEPLTAALPAGEWVTLPAHGTKLYPVTLAGVLLVEFMSSDSLRIGTAEMEVGDGGGPGGFFNRVRVKSATAQTVRLIVTSGDFAVSRIAGLVSVAGVVETAPDFSRSKADNAFMTGAECAASVANYSNCQLWNPAGSGVRAIINSLHVKCTDKAYLLGNLERLDNVGNTGLTGVVDWDAPSVLIRDVATPTYAETEGGMGHSSADSSTFVNKGWTVSHGLLPAGFDGYIPMASPLILEPDTGLSICGTVVNSPVAFIASFFEEAI